MLDADAAEELEQLKANLHQIRENYLEQWTGSARDERRNELFQFHLLKLEAEQVSINNLEQEIITKREATAALEQDSTAKDGETTQVQKIVSDLMARTEELQRTKQSVKEKLALTSTSLENKTQEADTLQKTFTTKQGHLSKALEFFETRLGLHIKKGQDGELEFNFTHIDESDWNRKFTFSIKVDDQNFYRVLRSDPCIEGMETLTKDLNETNNFSRFVSEVRARFKALARSQENKETSQKGSMPAEDLSAAAKVLDELTNKISVVEV